MAERLRALDPQAPLSLNMAVREVRSALGSWTIAEARPPHLAGVVDFMWHFDGALACLRERTFPSGMLEIIVHLGERYRVVERDGAVLCPWTCVTGVQLGPVIVEAPPRRTAVMGIRLTIAGAYALFRRPMRDVTGLTVDLHDLVGDAALELEDRCAAVVDPAARFSTAAAWITGRLRQGTRPDPVVRWALGQIQARSGGVSIADLRARTGVSKNRLTVLFREQAGVTPKQYARITRFRKALDTLHAGASSLVQVAHDAGYYDQPHMTAEFRELSGLTPGEFLHSLRYPNSVSVAEQP